MMHTECGITSVTQWNNQPKDRGLETRYHNCEQQGHEQCASYQQEDNENTDQLIQRALQPHYHLQRKRERVQFQQNKSDHSCKCVKTQKPASLCQT